MIIKHLSPLCRWSELDQLRVDDLVNNPHRSRVERGLLTPQRRTSPLAALRPSDRTVGRPVFPGDLGYRPMRLRLRLSGRASNQMC